jgi:hypothetical protein
MLKKKILLFLGLFFLFLIQTSNSLENKIL